MPPNSRRVLGRADLAGMALGVATFVATCLIATSHQPYYWYDELATSSLVADPSAVHMVGAIAHGAENNPPLYELLLRPWALLFGDGVVSLRLASAIAMSAALIIVWVALRRVYRTPSVAIGVATAFFGAGQVTQYAIQARFYGLFLAAAAVAVWLAIESSRSVILSRRFVVASFIAHAVLLYTHLFGVVYSGAILGAIVVAAALRRQWHPKLYVAVVAAWLTFVPWVPATMEQKKLTEPRNWMTPPPVSDFFNVLERQTHWVPFALLAVVLLGVLATLQTRTSSDIEAEPTSRARLAAVLIGVAVIAVVPFMFLVSRFVVPVFIDRYLLPSVIGWAIVIAEVTERGLPNLAQRSGLGTAGLPPALGAGYALVVAIFALMPIAVAHDFPRRARPEFATQAGARNLPVFVESAFIFWPLQRYANVKPSRYRFPLDMELALDPKNDPASVQELKLMDRYSREGYFARGEVVESSALLCSAPEFLVIDDTNRIWFERRIRDNPDFEWTDAGTYDDAAIRRVHYRGTACQTATPAAR